MFVKVIRQRHHQGRVWSGTPPTRKLPSRILSSRTWLFVQSSVNKTSFLACLPWLEYPQQLQGSLNLCFDVGRLVTLVGEAESRAWWALQADFLTPAAALPDEMASR